jgi:hypothetical protein
MVYVPPHALRHDALTARAARTLREVETSPADWLEGPQRRAERLELAPASPWRLVAAATGLGVGGLALVGLVVLVEGLR